MILKYLDGIVGCCNSRAAVLRYMYIESIFLWPSGRRQIIWQASAAEGRPGICLIKFLFGVSAKLVLAARARSSHRTLLIHHIPKFWISNTDIRCYSRISYTPILSVGCQRQPLLPVHGPPFLLLSHHGCELCSILLTYWWTNIFT